MRKNIRSTRCLFIGKILRSIIDFLYVKGNRLFSHKLPIILPSTGTYFLTYNVTFRKLVSGCLGKHLNKLLIVIRAPLQHTIICLSKYKQVSNIIH